MLLSDKRTTMQKLILAYKNFANLQTQFCDGNRTGDNKGQRKLIDELMATQGRGAGPSLNLA